MSPLLSVPLIVIQVSEISLFFLEKDISLERASVIKIEAFRMSLFDVKETWETATA